ncbi:MAG: TolC family protein [Pseudomonadota bacterium]
MRWLVASTAYMNAALIFILVMTMAASTKSASAQAPTEVALGPLSAEEVLRSSARYFPQILEVLAQRRVAEGRVTEADGAFDLVFSADGFERLTGTFDGGVIGGEATQNLRAFGGQVYGGYRRSGGLFPIYENINNTNRLGEAKIGALFSLLRDRTIDERRFLTRDARLALQQADFEVLLTKLGVQYGALTSYWRWVAAGRQLSVYENLLRIALAREVGLEEEVRRGARARIFITENRQNITRRQRLVTESRRDLLTAANALSLFYRNGAGDPIIPPDARLPEEALLSGLSLDEAIAPEFSEVAALRPELQILRTSLERAQREVLLRENELKPRFDVRAEVSRDFGDIGAGGSTFDSTDTIVGFQFSVPLQRRAAKGKVRQARAELEALQQRRRQTQDQIEIELRNILIDLNVSKQLVELARQEFDQSLTMQRAEQQRFASGASDFFLVNIREETAADAQIRLFLAALQKRIAQANFDAATVNLDQFELTDENDPS